MSLQTGDRPSGRFTWKIENFSKLKTKKLYSDVFRVGEYKWRVLIFPKGNNADYLSLYLDVADSETLPYGWSRDAHFNLALINQIDNEQTMQKDIQQHKFSDREHDWGFTKFIPLGELNDVYKGYLVNDTIVVEADVTVHNSQDSKTATGYVGLESLEPEQGSREEESHHPSQDNNSESVADVTGITASFLQDSREATPEANASTIPGAGDHASSCQVSGCSNVCPVYEPPAGKVEFLSYRVSPEASLVLKRIHDHHNATFIKFSMTSPILQTSLLESFASFIDSMTATKVNEVNNEALRLAILSIEDFEQVGLDLSWLKQRLDEAKRVNKLSESLVSVKSYESAVTVARAKVRELEEGLAKAKAEMEVMSRALCNSLGLNDTLLKDVV
ncbi:ubiquitinyl hydrolase 1 [Sarracenia purpurea var. burkii]